MPSFSRYIGVDYSGAMTPNDSLEGLSVYEAKGRSPPEEIPPPPSPRRYASGGKRSGKPWKIPAGR